MATTVNFNLSSQLQTTLANAGSGTYAYAFAFGASTPGGAPSLVSQATLVSAGAMQSGASLSLPAPNFYNGTIYVVIQQGGDGTLPSNISSTEDIINNSGTYNYSYQLYEATLSGGQFDQGDISAVNSFGFASTYEVVYSNGTSATRGFSSSASDIFAALPSSAVVDYNPNAFTDPQQLANGPANANGQAPWSASGWQTYVDALKNDKATLDQIQIVDSFAGSALQSQAMLSQYGVQYVKHDKYGDDYFWLVPNTSNGATNTDWIRIPVSQLTQNIFQQTGQLEVHQGGKDGSVVIYDTFTPNNADGSVAKHFIAGFDAGYWGATGTSPNALDTTTLNFNQDYNWNINYAYGAALLTNVGAATYTNALIPQNPSAGDFFYDPWAKQFLVSSNAYGYSYSDLVSAGGVSPLVLLWDASAGANVGTINITLYDTGETPASGYAPSSSGWIAPLATSTPANTYEDALTPATNQLGFDFNFYVGSTLYAPDAKTPITLKIYAPSSAQAGPDGFISLDAAGTDSNWHYFIVNNNGGQLSLQVSNATGEEGFFNLQNLPSTADGSPSWYQVVFGGEGAQTIYNIYATTDTATGEFTNLVIDHGVTVTQNSTSDYTLFFAPGGHMFYDIDTFSAPVTEDASAPGVTIVGTSHDDFVNAITTVAGEQKPTNRADTIFGGKGDDQLSGLGGNDTIDGGKGNDFLRGGDGDDVLQVRGSEGKFDSFDGGSGTDTLQFVGWLPVSLNGFDAQASSIEKLEGNGWGVFGTGNSDVFDLSGLTSMSKLPFVWGLGGNDTLIGSQFDDRLTGGSGDDILDGRGGDDLLVGGPGRNTYIFGDGYGADTIAGYKAGKDKLDFVGVTGVHSLDDLTLTQIGRNTVRIEFDGHGDTLTLQDTTIEKLLAHPGDFLFA